MADIREKIIKKLLKKIPKTEDDFGAVLRSESRGMLENKGTPRKSDLLRVYHELVKAGKIKKSPALEKLLIKRAVRTMSGVAIITVLTKPFECPGKCVYCPNEKQMPKSYLSDEPAAARALLLNFDPYVQVQARIEALKNNGHPTDKIELIVKGGTWNAYPLSYQYWFIWRCFEGVNSLKHGSIKTLKQNIVEIKKQLQTAQKKNETAKHRIIGLTLETRPDQINEKNIFVMRELGCTRVELGAQTIDEKILKLIRRGHGANETIQATELLKNYGFKVDFHLMPQLPGSTPAKDARMLAEIFDNPNYRPDMIKIYPCTTTKNSPLYQWVKSKKYKPYSDKKLIELLINFKTTIPRYARVSRLIRDIPGHHIMAGNKMTNLRQVIQAEMAHRGLKCNCLRCREIGHNDMKTLKHENIKTIMPKLFIDKYVASDGTEYFLSFEDAKRQVVYAFCRLRICSPVIPTVAKRSGGIPPATPKGSLPIGQAGLDFARDNKTVAFIRELHTYGQSLLLKQKNNKTLKHIQHKGLGKRLVKEVEKICKKNKIPILAVISGVGVRDYYRKLGYRLENTYMIKNF
jgi:elongator complex protein 3